MRLHHPNLCGFCLCGPSFVSLWGAPSVSRPRAGPQSPSRALVLPSCVRSLPGPVWPRTRARLSVLSPCGARAHLVGTRVIRLPRSGGIRRRRGVYWAPPGQQAPSLARGGFIRPQPGVRGWVHKPQGWAWPVHSIPPPPLCPLTRLAQSTTWFARVCVCVCVWARVQVT